MENRIYDENNGLWYERQGDYYLLDLELPPQEPVPLNRFGRKRLYYLKEHRRVMYTNLLMSGKLNEHLRKVQEGAQAQYDNLVEQMKKNRSVTEKLKVSDQMEWVGAMNNIRNCAEEIVLNEIIHR